VPIAPVKLGGTESWFFPDNCLFSLKKSAGLRNPDWKNKFWYFCLILTLQMFTGIYGKTHFGILLPFRRTLPDWGQYFQLILNFRLQVLQNLCLQLNFRLSQNFRLADFWYNTELLSNGGLDEAPVRLGYVRLANILPRFPTGGTGAKPLLGSAITVPWLPTGGAARGRSPC
jgi:hypothetical protein